MDKQLAPYWFWPETLHECEYRWDHRLQPGELVKDYRHPWPHPLRYMAAPSGLDNGFEARLSQKVR